MTQDAQLRCSRCNGPLVASAPIDYGDAVNVTYACDEHGVQFEVSTAKDLAGSGQTGSAS